MKQRNGDLLRMFSAGEFDVIIHGCNCFHAMGAGIAGQIARQFPKAVLIDRENTKYGDIMKLSNHSIAHVGEGKLIVNLYSQYLPGADLNKEALYLGLYKLTKVLDVKHRIGIPAIGCGIAGGDWSEIGPVISRIMQSFNVTYIEYEPIKQLFDNGEN